MCKVTGHHLSRDVTEGRSVFILGLPMVATEERVKETLSMFGAVKQVKFCMNRDTGVFKQSGFAEFKTKEAAMQCVDTSRDPAYKNDFMIDGQVIKCLKALTKTAIDRLEKPAYSDNPKDKRNIYLTREGVVREGTRAAEGVSKLDLSIRVEREKMKHTYLKNLHNFVSTTRLFFCNIPATINDKEIKAIFKENSPSEAVITECRIMKNLGDVPPTSKSYGFINFTEHTHALAALRELNNNPDIFTKKKRPIVEFSIENKAALNAKLRRQLKSRENVNKTKAELEEEKQARTESKPVTMNNARFVGGRSKKGMKLATHFGARGNSKKVTRNKINNKERRKMKQIKKRIEKKKEN